jgi:hypothetical protein
MNTKIFLPYSKGKTSHDRCTNCMSILLMAFHYEQNASPYHSQLWHLQANAGHTTPHCSSDQYNELPVIQNRLHKLLPCSKTLLILKYTKISVDNVLRFSNTFTCDTEKKSGKVTIKIQSVMLLVFQSIVEVLYTLSLFITFSVTEN